MSEEVQIPVSNAQHDVQPVEQNGGINWTTEPWNEDTLNSLPDNMGQHSIFSKYTTPEAFIQGAINAQSQIGQKASDFLHSDDESIIAQRNEILGVPKDANGYNIELPEGFDASDADIEDFSQTMHQLGLTNKQAQAIAEYQLNNFSEIIEKVQAQDRITAEESETELRQLWKGDTYDYNISKIGDALEYLGLSTWRDNPNIANNPDFLIGMVDKILPLFTDDQLIEGGVNESYSSIDDQLRQLETAMLTHDNQNSPEYQQMMKQRFELMQKLS